jgi:hypothetical protein
MANGIVKSGNSLSKDFESESYFFSSEKMQRVLDLSNKIMPPGTILAWMDGFFTGSGNIGYTSEKPTTYPSLKDAKTIEGFYVIADGAFCSIPESLYFGQNIPQLIDNRFLMGETSSIGQSGGSNFLLDHTHTNSLTATLTMSATYSFSHNHSTYGGSATSARLSSHNFQVADYDVAYSYKDKDTLSSDDHENHTDDVAGLGLLSWPQHYHSGSKNSTDSSSLSILAPSHQHIITMTPSSHIGSGSYPSFTDNRPRFLQCIYLFKVL